MTKRNATPEELNKALEDLGIEEVPSDHPIYGGSPSLRFSDSQKTSMLSTNIGQITKISEAVRQMSDVMGAGEIAINKGELDQDRINELSADFGLILLHYNDRIEPLSECDLNKFVYNLCCLIFKVMIELAWFFNKYDLLAVAYQCAVSYENKDLKNHLTEGFDRLLLNQGLNPKFFFFPEECSGDSLQINNTNPSYAEYLKILKDKNKFDPNDIYPEKNIIFERKSPFEIFISGEI